MYLEQLLYFTDINMLMSTNILIFWLFSIFFFAVWPGASRRRILPAMSFDGFNIMILVCKNVVLPPGKGFLALWQIKTPLKAAALSGRAGHVIFAAYCNQKAA